MYYFLWGIILWKIKSYIKLVRWLACMKTHNATVNILCVVSARSGIPIMAQETHMSHHVLSTDLKNDLKNDLANG